MTVARIRFTAMLLPALLLGACTDTTDLPAPFDTLNAVFFPPSAPTAQEIDVDKLPVAAILVGFGRGSARVALAGTQDGTLIWRAADRAEIHTRHGVLMRTVGLPDNLHIVRIDGLPEGASTPVPAAAGARPYVRIFDLPNRRLYGARADCSLAEVGQEPLQIGQYRFDTVVYDETCTVEAMRWRYTNRYWYEPDSTRVWRSVQHISPDMGDMDITLLRSAPIP